MKVGTLLRIVWQEQSIITLLLLSETKRMSQGCIRQSQRVLIESQPHAIPWEKEAYWAGHTEGMTAAALESCAAGTMWTDYEPTPMTREWLVEKGFIAK